jgi:hypothetical protein
MQELECYCAQWTCCMHVDRAEYQRQHGQQLRRRQYLAACPGSQCGTACAAQQQCSMVAKVSHMQELTVSHQLQELQHAVEQLNLKTHADPAVRRSHCSSKQCMRT